MEKWHMGRDRIGGARTETNKGETELMMHELQKRNKKLIQM